jgi:hypothetical protein
MQSDSEPEFLRWHPLTFLMCVMSGATLFVLPAFLYAQATAGPDLQKLDDKSFVELTDERQSLEKEILQLQQEVDALNTRLADRDTLEQQKAYIEKTYANVSPSTPKPIKDSYNAQLRDLQNRIDLAEMKDPKRVLIATLHDKSVILDSKKQQKIQVEQKMSDLLNIEKPRQNFKTSMSRVFAALVGLVIIGFFVIAWRDESVRREIFGGQAGIQFITLFSLIIAIILFGITGILQDKELAALLGGLSGYILGRGSKDAPAPPPTAQPSPTQNANAPAEAPPEPPTSQGSPERSTEDKNKENVA